MLCDSQHIIGMCFKSAKKDQTVPPVLQEKLLSVNTDVALSLHIHRKYTRITAESEGLVCCEDSLQSRN